MTLGDFHFRHDLRVRWSEIDMQGVVFNAHFLTYYDVAMTEYLRAVDFPYPQGLVERGMDLHIRKSSLEWLSFVTYDETISIHTRVSRIGRSSITFQFEIHRPGEDGPLALGENVYVNVSVATKKPEAVPAELAAAISAFEGRDVTRN